ncbi:MAG: nuclear transport factor 2 family protein [Nocardioides sp.]
MSLGKRFATAMAEKDAETLRDLLTHDVDFKGLTPGRFWEAGTPEEVAAILFGTWFAPDDHIERLVAAEDGEDVADVHRVGYRFEVTTPDGPHTVEQQAYYRQADGRLSYVRVVCSGFRPSTGDPTTRGPVEVS